MFRRADAEAFVLRTLRKHGPALLGARRRFHHDARGRRTPYLEMGRDVDGTLVFLHGFSDRPEHFLATAGLLKDRYRILAPALPAFGDGFVDRTAHHDFHAWGEWISDTLRAIAPRRFHLMGNSLGGSTALGVATRMPERLESLVLVDTAGVKPKHVSCVFDGYGEGPNPFEVRTPEDFDRFMGRISNKPNPALRAFGGALYEEALGNADWYVRLGRELGSAVKAFHSVGEDSFVDLAAIEVPTLVVWGDEDSLFPTAIGEHIASTIPNARLEVLRGVGHCPHLEAPKPLARAFTTFADELRGRPATRASSSSRAGSQAPRA